MGGAAAIWENASRILQIFCVFGASHALRPLRGGGMIPPSLKQPIGDRTMRKLVVLVFAAGMLWHLVPGQIVRKLPQSRHGTCMPATEIQFFEMSEEQS